MNIKDEEIVYVSKQLIVNDSVYNLPYGSDIVEYDVLNDNYELYFISPFQVLSYIYENLTTLHYVSEDVVGFNNKYGKKFYVYFNKDNYIVKVEVLHYDLIYGDSKSEIIYDYISRVSGASFKLPSKVLLKRNGLLFKSLLITNVSSNFDIDVEYIRDFCDSCEMEGSEQVLDLSIAEVSNGLWVLNIFDYNIKILVSDSNEFISVFEAPIGIALSRKVVKFLNSHFKNKPIKYCFISHHHPDHAGGFQAFIEAGAKIVSTTDNISYFQKLLKASHSMSIKNLSIDYNYEPFFINVASDGVSSFLEDDFDLKVIEAGALTSHTDDYLFFYFSKSGILFVADLIFFPMNGYKQQGVRAFSVFNVIKDNGLMVEKIYTAWPLLNQKDYGNLDDLYNSLSTNYPNLKKEYILK